MISLCGVTDKPGGAERTGFGGAVAGRPHIKPLSYQQLISEVIVQSRPDFPLSVADLRLLALEQVHRHMSNHPDIVRGIASTNSALVFPERHAQPPMQLVVEPVDFRKQITGLATLVQDTLAMDPFMAGSSRGRRTGFADSYRIGAGSGWPACRAAHCELRNRPRPVRGSDRARRSRGRASRDPCSSSRWRWRPVPRPAAAARCVRVCGRRDARFPRSGRRRATQAAMWGVSRYSLASDSSLLRNGPISTSSRVVVVTTSS